MEGGYPMDDSTMSYNDAPNGYQNDRMDMAMDQQNLQSTDYINSAENDGAGADRGILVDDRRETAGQYPRNQLVYERKQELPTKIFVKNVDCTTTEKQLFDLFSQAGPIAEIIMVESEDNRSRGIAFINYFERKDGEEAERRFDKYELNGRPIEVRYAKRQPRPYDNEKMSLKPLTASDVSDVPKWTKRPKKFVDTYERREPHFETRYRDSYERRDSYDRRDEYDRRRDDYDYDRYRRVDDRDRRYDDRYDDRYSDRRYDRYDDRRSGYERRYNDRYNDRYDNHYDRRDDRSRPAPPRYERSDRDQPKSYDYSRYDRDEPPRYDRYERDERYENSYSRY